MIKGIIDSTPKVWESSVSNDHQESSVSNDHQESSVSNDHQELSVSNVAHTHKAKSILTFIMDRRPTEFNKSFYI